MANYTTSADLLDDALSRAGEPTDGTSDVNADAIRLLNRAYQALWSGGSEIDPDVNEVWWWLRKDDQGVLTLNPKITDGTVSVTNNSASITFSSGPTPSVAGRHFKVSDHADVFIVSSHTAGATAATLESVYTGDTDATANYTVFQLDYDLASDLLYLSTPMRAYQSNREGINLISHEELLQKWPLEGIHSGVPVDFAMIGERKVRFSHCGMSTSTDLIKVDYEYVKEPSDLADDTSEPLVPRQYRKLLADWTLYYLLDKKDDSRAVDVATLVKQGVMAMAKENRRRMHFGSRNFGKIIPRQHELTRYERPLRTESGLIIGY